jgi:poly(3-hydroxybutyrate) depolymerase
LEFVDLMLRQLHQKFSIDDRRIYATGFSNGGRFCYILWSQRSNVFAAFGICAGVIREPVRLTEPKPLLHIAGENDEVAHSTSSNKQSQWRSKSTAVLSKDNRAARVAPSIRRRRTRRSK